MDKEKSTNTADAKRAERLARLKELHYRRVCIKHKLMNRSFHFITYHTALKET